MHKIPIMAHTVIGYPSLAESEAIVTTYMEKGIEILELQIPFSHPTADGTVLSIANQKAIKNGVTLRDSLAFLKRIRKAYPQQKIMVMTYMNKLFHFGISAFCNSLALMNITEVIIPDLPYDNLLAQAIHQHRKMQLVPVIASNIPMNRLHKILEMQPPYFYIMADFKITGGQFSIHPKVKNLVQLIRARSQAKIGVGFGISTPKQVQEVLTLADFAIIGSAFTTAINEGNLEEKLEAMKKHIAITYS